MGRRNKITKGTSKRNAKKGIGKSIGFSKEQISSEKNPVGDNSLPTEKYTEEEKEIIKNIEEAMEIADNNVIRINNTGTLIHKGFSKDDIKQKYVQYAYKLGGMDFVYMIECENGNWNINAVGDNGKAFGLCQMNTNYHKLPDEYKTNWVVQVEYCYNKWKQGVAFYGPTRIVKGQKCYNYVKSRFTLEQNNNG